MKYLVALCLLAAVVSSMSLKQAYQTHQSRTIAQRHDLANGTLIHEKVNVADAIDAAGSAAQAAIKLARVLINAFDVTCSVTGYKRGNNINIFNGLSTEITLVEHYQDSGKVNEYAHHRLAPNNVATWRFVKHAGSATGSNGVVAYNLPDRTLVIFYENPWSSWNFAGVCLYPKENMSHSRLRGIYHNLYSSHGRWPSNCVLADNTRSKRTPFESSLSLNTNGYRVGALVKYEFIDKAGPNDCYTQEIDVVVRRQ